MGDDPPVWLDALHVHAMLLVSDRHAPPQQAVPALLRRSVFRDGFLGARRCGHGGVHYAISNAPKNKKNKKIKKCAVLRNR